MPFQTSPKPTQYEADIQGNSFRFGALSMRYIETMTAKEQEAFDKQDTVAVVGIHQDMVLTALNRAEGSEVTAEDIKELDAPMFSSLFSAILKSHGMKPDNTVGELQPQ